MNYALLSYKQNISMRYWDGYCKQRANISKLCIISITTIVILHQWVLPKDFFFYEERISVLKFAEYFNKITNNIARH